MKKFFSFLTAALILGMGQTVATNRLTVSDVNVAQGGEATLEIGCEFDTEYTAFELQLALPEGLSLKTDDEGYPVVERAFDTNHILTGNLLPSNGNYKITCRSMDNLSMPTNGPLFRLTMMADASLALGTTLNATVTACEFTRTADSQGESLDDVPFTVNITEFRTILDEASTTMPVAEANANVRVLRTINANEWSTICLPFAMTEAQVKTAFGEEVELGDFTSWSSEKDEDDAIIAINVGFTTVSEIEANHPYIIKVREKVTEFTVDGVDIAPEEEPMVQVGRRAAERGWMYGTYVVTTVPEENVFLSGNQFWYSTGKTQTMGLRGYFEFRDVLDAYYDAAGAGARITMSFGDNTTTGVQMTANRKYENSKCFDLQGRRVTNPGKGLYIQNGKKVTK